MESLPTFVLVHSPLVGPSTWGLVAVQLKARGFGVAVPTLAASEAGDTPCWKQCVSAAVRDLTSIPAAQPLIWVGHSAAGPHLPALRRAVSHPVRGYVFADASIPRDRASHLDLLLSDFPEEAAQIRQLLAAGGRYPTWNDAELSEAIPDADLRRQVLTEMHPYALSFYEEAIPVFAGWPDAPCYFLQLSSAYSVPAARARENGWAVSEIGAEHFHMLVYPEAVANALLRLLRLSR